MSTPENPRPGAWLRPDDQPEGQPGDRDDHRPDDPTAGDLATRLAGLPVAEHADVLAAEHDRLHRLLATVDQL